jgi:NAD(P)-dependent dehydrogenase (short-subunit alcohol dehydrogenase family)
MTDASQNKKMAGKICMVTGANSGIGKVTALELAKMGATVTIVCRNRDKGEAAIREIKESIGSSSLELLVADLSSQAEIRRLAAEFQNKHDRLDVLVNNAGVFLRQRSITPDGIETTFAVNHLAYFLLTRLLLDTLKRSTPARIVNVSSRAHTSATINFDDLQGEREYGGWRAYCQSKLANILFTYELARMVEGSSGVTVNCLHPGVIATGLLRSVPRILHLPLRILLSTPETGAETSVYLAASPEVEGVTGKYFVKKRAVASSAESQNPETARRLWNVSEQLTGLNPA